MESVNVNGTDKRGYTALSKAAGKGHTDVVEALLASDADLTITNKVANH